MTLPGGCSLLTRAAAARSYQLESVSSEPFKQRRWALVAGIAQIGSLAHLIALLYRQICRMLQLKIEDGFMSCRWRLSHVPGRDASGEPLSTSM